MTGEAENTLSSVERTLDVLEYLKNAERASVTELAEALDAPSSTVYNYLRTLKNREYVRKTDGEYELANRFVHFGDFARVRLPLYRTGKPNIVWLAEETGRTVNLVVEEFGRGIYLSTANRERHLRNFAHARRREYLHTTAAGRAVLMTMTDDEIDDVVDEHGLPARTDNSITDREELFETVERARERGYTVNDEENTPGIRAVGAPVENPDGPYGSVSLSGLASRCSLEELHDDLAPKVRDTAEAISLELQS
ncbi:IclR family transcriptional regulator [Halobacterium yunchengense]|uniref:IclR family transcriptional regulator n=1 Tax=Halobacterium yunchengense TaxID=3108497 RepID=UPI00300B6F5F